MTALLILLYVLSFAGLFAALAGFLLSISPLNFLLDAPVHCYLQWDMDEWELRRHDEWYDGPHFCLWASPLVISISP